jgi:hypothetical protein
MMQEMTDPHRLSTAKAYYEDSDGPDLDLDLNVVRQAKDRGYDDSCWERFSDCILKLDPWKLIPSIIVSNAFSCSLTVLTLCTLAEVSTEGEPDPISFGLWSFSDPDIDEYGNLHIPTPLDYIRTCQYTPIGDKSGPPQVFLDPNFRTARACGVLAVSIGFLTMSMMWLGVIRDYESTTNWRLWVGISLVVCGVLEGMTLWILKSGVCDSVILGKYSNCKIAHGGHTVIIACTLWFAAGVLLIKWPRKNESNQRHSTLAGDEADEAKNVYPEIIGFWQHIIRNLDDEQQIELEKMRGGRPGMGAPQSSLHSMMESFDDELSVCSNTGTAPKRLGPPPTTNTSGEPTGEAASSRSPSWRVPRLASASMHDEINLRRPSLHEFLEAFDDQDIL